MYFVFLNRMQKDKDVIQIDMDELADAITEDCSHQSLESRGCIAITHLHHLAHECAKDGCKGCLMDMLCVFVHMPQTWTCSSAMHSCSYTLDILSFDQYAALAISL